MSGKKLDATTIVNELKGSSLFFQEYKATVSQRTANNAHTSAGVPSPTFQQSTPTPHSSLPFPSSHEPSRGPTVLTPLARGPEPEAVSPQNDASIPANPATQHQRNDEETIVPPGERRNERSNERTKVRHSFDILSDQLFALRELAVERERTFGRKVLLGDLVQEALDLFIARQRNHD